MFSLDGTETLEQMKELGSKDRDIGTERQKGRRKARGGKKEERTNGRNKRREGGKGDRRGRAGGRDKEGKGLCEALCKTGS